MHKTPRNANQKEEERLHPAETPKNDETLNVQQTVPKCEGYIAPKMIDGPDGSDQQIFQKEKLHLQIYN